MRHYNSLDPNLTSNQLESEREKATRTTTNRKRARSRDQEADARKEMGGIAKRLPTRESTIESIRLVEGLPFDHRNQQRRSVHDRRLQDTSSQSPGLQQTSSPSSDINNQDAHTCSRNFVSEEGIHQSQNKLDSCGFSQKNAHSKPFPSHSFQVAQTTFPLLNNPQTGDASFSTCAYGDETGGCSLIAPHPQAVEKQRINANPRDDSEASHDDKRYQSRPPYPHFSEQTSHHERVGLQMFDANESFPFTSLRQDEQLQACRETSPFISMPLHRRASTGTEMAPERQIETGEYAALPRELQRRASCPSCSGGTSSARSSSESRKRHYLESSNSRGTCGACGADSRTGALKNEAACDHWSDRFFEREFNPVSQTPIRYPESNFRGHEQAPSQDERHAERSFHSVGQTYYATLPPPPHLAAAAPHYSTAPLFEQHHQPPNALKAPPMMNQKDILPLNTTPMVHPHTSQYSALKDLHQSILPSMLSTGRAPPRVAIYKTAKKPSNGKGERPRKRQKETKKPPTAYNVFFKHESHKIHQTTPSMPFDEISKTIASSWKVLEPAERRRFEIMAREDKRHKLHEPTETPCCSCKAPGNKISRPSRPLCAYNLFFKDERQWLKEQDRHLSFSELGKFIAGRWRGLSPEGRAPYNQRARVEKEQFERKKREFQRAAAGLLSAEACQCVCHQNRTSGLTAAAPTTLTAL